LTLVKAHYKTSISYSELKGPREILQIIQQAPWSLKGHTDSKGSSELNRFTISKTRSAIAVVLVDSFRIKPDRVKRYGYGGNSPLSPA